jgi:hypothetical protein
MINSKVPFFGHWKYGTATVILDRGVIFFFQNPSLPSSGSARTGGATSRLWSLPARGTRKVSLRERDAESERRRSTDGGCASRRRRTEGKARKVRRRRGRSRRRNQIQEEGRLCSGSSAGVWVSAVRPAGERGGGGGVGGPWTWRWRTPTPSTAASASSRSSLPSSRYWLVLVLHEHSLPQAMIQLFSVPKDLLSPDGTDLCLVTTNFYLFICSLLCYSTRKSVHFPSTTSAIHDGLQEHTKSMWWERNMVESSSNFPQSLSFPIDWRG